MESEKVKQELQEAVSLCTRELQKGLLVDTLTLINELESENAYKQEHIEMWFRKNEEKKKRIAELEKEVETRKAEVLHLQEYGKKLIRETELKQFAERLKEKARNGMIDNGEYKTYEEVIARESIYETLKEFINE